MTVTSPTTTRPYDEPSVSHLGFWASTAAEREQTFKILRNERPISWQRTLEGALLPPQNEGVWVVTSHELVTQVSKSPDLFSSAGGVQFEEVPDDINVAASSFLAMDAPQHGKLRRLVSTAFTPKRVATIHDQIRAQARRIVDELLAEGEGDFVQTVSKKLPMWTIYEMLGLEDQDLREEAAHHADGMVSWADEDVAAGRSAVELLNDSLVGLLSMGLDLAAQRRAHPKADLMTALVEAEVDGEKLSDEDIASFFVLLSVAGNDTTRNSISVATKALQDFPDQRQLLVDDFDGHIVTAIEEFVRWASPVMTFRRTATQDTELGGQLIREGEWVAMIFASANRDEKVFENPDVLDLTRNPNPHVGFGGGGPHYCMGNFVAKMQLREIFEQLIHRAPTLTVGEPTYLAGNFVHAVKALPYTL